MPDSIHQLLATRAALEKLGARGISRAEWTQILRNSHVIVRNVRGRPERLQRPLRRLLIGRTDGGRALTLVIEQTADPTDWLLVTGWRSSLTERRILLNARKAR
jgi:hypothetical protein